MVQQQLEFEDLGNDRKNRLGQQQTTNLQALCTSTA